ncbi:MAG: glycosyltransferase [Calditrichaeota bacterium]|nr:MAG: glycosyltransferase [Calditrichota bacterium]
MAAKPTISLQPERFPSLSVVIPLYNEAESLPELYRQLAASLNQVKNRAEIIFVDDGSVDDSFAILQSLQREDRRIKLIQFRRNYGKSAALAEGFARAQGDYVITMDADLQDDPAEIANLIQKLEQGFDLVSGWKKKRYDPFIKRTSSKVFNRVTGWLTGVRLHDINCGLKIYRKDVVKTIRLYGQRHRFLPVLAAQEGFKVGEVVVRHHPRKYGRSKYGPSRFLAGLLDLISLLFLSRYVKRPLHLFGGFGLVIFLAGAWINVYLAYERLLLHKYLTNRPLLYLGVLLVIVGIQLFSLGLLGEMITEARPASMQYSIRAEIGFEKEKREQVL